MGVLLLRFFRFYFSFHKSIIGANSYEKTHNISFAQNKSINLRKKNVRFDLEVFSWAYKIEIPIT